MSNDERYEGFRDYAELLEWVDAAHENPRAQPLRYQGPSDEKPRKVSTRVDRRDPRNYVIRVSSYLGWQCEPFTADVTHLPYFRRWVSEFGEGVRPARHQVGNRVSHGVDVEKLEEPTSEAEVCVCMECSARYRPFPYQSKRKCKRCLPPPKRCRHGVIEWEPCAECQRMTGSSARLGLR